MPPKRFAIGQEKGFIGESKSKSKPRIIIEQDWIKEYREHRDICWFIKFGGECLWSDDKIEKIKQLYFKDYQTKLL